MKTLIVGGGVAGTVAALALHKAGYDPVIYEAYEESTGLAHSVYLTVAVNGLDALRAVDAHHVVLDAGFPSRQMQFLSGTGKHLGSLALGPELSDGTVTHTIRRSDLYHGLAAEVRRRGIQIKYNKRLVGATTLANGGVAAYFADGSAGEGDLLVGADGVHSSTRRVLDVYAPEPRYVGLGNTGGFAHVEHLDAKRGDYVMIWGRNCFFGYTVSPGGEVWWFANPPSRTEWSRAELRSMTPAAIRDRLIELLAFDKTPGVKIVASTIGSITLSNQYDLPSVPTWHNGSMALIGDAAHAVSPASGQGASLAAEDAVTLALCLRDSRTIPIALDAYERMRRARVERVVAWGASMNDTKQPGVIGRFLRDLVLPVILKRAARPDAMQEMAWLFDHHIEWEVPSIADAAEVVDVDTGTHDQPATEVQ
ncbi:MAG TPA: NAD(P)/FAD-dependent oxidoreductase [Gemmatimonadaceae bacterium]|nr:NAD(P)/FAD-dependent oxidoreductase [Gemmatimonadaceae bacterium]